MTRRVRVLPEAEAELASAAQWYERSRAGLGVELMAAADEAVESLRELPESAPPWRPGHPARKHRLRRFPYLVIYRLIGSDLEIVAFAHDKRRPGYWLKRQ